tara:strand:- start:5 stop:247 length:243 start_codon:yes stop_codon:yes gene_type:complete
MRALLLVLLVIPLGLFAQEQIEDIEPTAAIKPAASMKPPATISPAAPIAPIPEVGAVSDIDFKPSEEISEDFPIALPSDI